MSNADYGTYSTMLNIATLATTLLGFGLSDTLMRYFAEARAAENPFQFNILKAFLLLRLLTGLGTGLVLLIAAPVLGSWSNNNLVGQLGWLLLLLVASSNISELLNSYAIASMQLKLSFIVRSLTQLAGLIVTVSWFWLVKPEPVIPLLFIFFTQLVQILIYLRGISFVKLRQAAAIPRQVLNSIVKYARDVWIISLFTYILAGQFDIIVLAFVLKDPNQVAYYTLTVLILTRVQTLITGWNTSSLAVLSSVQTEKGKAGLSRYFNYYYKLSLLSMLPVMIGMVSIASVLIPLLFTTRYNPAVPLVYIYTFSTCVSICLSALSTTSVILTLSRQNKVLPWRIAFSIVNAILDLALVPAFGALGVVVATGLANVSLHVVELLLVRDIIQDFPLLFLGKILGAAGLASVTTFGIVSLIDSHLAGLIFGSIAFGAILITSLLVLKPFDKSDLELAQNLKPTLAAKLRYFCRS